MTHHSVASRKQAIKLAFVTFAILSAKRVRRRNVYIAFDT